MSAYRSELPRLERRLHELEGELAELGEDDASPLARDRRRRDARVRLFTGLFVLVAGPLGAFWLGAVLGSSALRLRPAPPPAAAVDDTLARAAEARRATCNRDVHGVEGDLHACEIALADALDGRGVEVTQQDGLDGLDDSTLASTLAAHAAPVLTCLSDRARLRFTFGADGQVAALDFDPTDRLAPGEEACIRAALPPLTGPVGMSVFATFSAP